MAGPGLAESWRELSAAQKSGVGVPFYMAKVNRRLGRALACVGARWGATPHQVTFASGAAATAGLLVVATFEPSFAMAILATLLMQFAFALDSADGQLARVRGGGSSAGEWLDHVFDCARTTAFHTAIGISLFRFADVDAIALFIPLGFGFVAVVRFFALILAEQLQRSSGSNEPPRGSWRSALIQTPADVGVQNFALLLLPWTTAFLIVYGILAMGNAALLAASLARKHSDLVAMSP